jgi:hypothetical protein
MRFLVCPLCAANLMRLRFPSPFISSKAYQSKDNAGSTEYRKTVREKLKAIYNRVFACPGNCGNCLPGGRHACGSKEFSGIAIGIGIHA